VAWLGRGARGAPARPVQRTVLPASSPHPRLAAVARGPASPTRPPLPGALPRPCPYPTRGPRPRHSSSRREDPFPIRGTPASPRSGRGVPAPCGAASCTRPRPRPGPGGSPRPCAVRPRPGAASACAAVVPLRSAARAQLGPGVCVTRSRCVSAALRTCARVVHAVLWHSSLCPRRARLPPRRARLPPRRARLPPPPPLNTF
jgi:hypothetical protein